MKTLPVSSVKSAFTFVELLIVVGIIGLLTAVVLPSFGDFAQRRALQNSTDQLASNIKLARNKSLSGVRVGNQEVVWGFNPGCGSNSYQLGYRPIDEDGNFDGSAVWTTFSQDMGEGLEFDDSAANGGSCAPAGTDTVFFDLFSGEIKDGASRSYRITYTAGLSGTLFRTLRISESGSVWVE